LTKGDESTRVGQVVTWSVITSALGPPMGKVQTYLRYGYGLDHTKELIGISLDFGIIEKNGPSWYVFAGEKFQGEEKLRTFLLENPAKLEELKQMVNTHLG
jgi:hypothetical protein